MHAFKQQTPDANAHDLTLARRRFFEEWRQRSNEEGPQIRSVASSVAEEARGQCSDSEEELEVPHAFDAFQAGDSKWPVRLEVFDAVFSNSFGQSEGIALKAHALRKEFQSRMIVQDQGEVPIDAVYEYRYCCSELHVGLCATHDAAIYNDARNLARNIERCLGADQLHSYFSFEIPGDVFEDCCSCFMFGAARAVALHLMIIYDKTCPRYTVTLEDMVSPIGLAGHVTRHTPSHTTSRALSHGTCHI